LKLESIKIPSAELSPPTIIHADKHDQTPNSQQRTGTLAPLDLQFLETHCDTEVGYYTLVSSGLKYPDSTMTIYQAAFEAQLRRSSFVKCVRQGHHIVDYDSDADYDTLSMLLWNALKLVPPSVKLVLFVLAKKDIPLYSAFKDVTDRMGLRSICVTEDMKSLEARKITNRKIQEARKSVVDSLVAYMAHVVKKVNIQFARVNRTADHIGETNLVSSTLQSTLILGADVTHPGPDALPGSPSIAAIVGSVNAEGSQFFGSMRLQGTNKNEVCAPTA
jgi:eukaryotic translation initiation factor 2C